MKPIRDANPTLVALLWFLLLFALIFLFIVISIWLGRLLA